MSTAAAARGVEAQLRALLARHPGAAARLRRGLRRTPRLRRLLRGGLQLAWWTAARPALRRTLARLGRAEAAARVPASAELPAPLQELLADPRYRLRALTPATPPPPGARGARRLLCLSHVLPHPARAGNEYRLARLLRWLAQQGWDVLLVACPQSAAEADESRCLATAQLVPDLIVCGRDGTLRHSLLSGDLALEKLVGQRPRSFASALGEDLDASGPARRVTNVLRSFCPDVLVELLLHLEQQLAPQLVLAEYVFMTRAFPLLGPGVHRVIDTSDVFSNKRRALEQHGVRDALALAEHEEAALLARAELLVAIQPEEADDLRRLAPTRRVISAGVDFDVARELPPPAAQPVVLLIGSDNPLNVKGLQDFLRFAWPLVRRAVPAAELRIGGSLGARAELWSPELRALGWIPDLERVYAEARVVINPAVGGTGLKIKTIEALCRLRPVVTWPAGVEGLAPQMRALCHVATDWFSFAERVSELLRGDHADHSFSERRQQELRRHFAPDRVYAELAQALDELAAKPAADAGAR